jgi:hypothetical protein
MNHFGFKPFTKYLGYREKGKRWLLLIDQNIVPSERITTFANSTTRSCVYGYEKEPNQLHYLGPPPEQVIAEQII